MSSSTSADRGGQRPARTALAVHQRHRGRRGSAAGPRIASPIAGAMPPSSEAVPGLGSGGVDQRQHRQAEPVGQPVGPGGQPEAVRGRPHAASGRRAPPRPPAGRPPGRARRRPCASPRGARRGTASVSSRAEQVAPPDGRARRERCTCSQPPLRGPPGGCVRGRGDRARVGGQRPQARGEPPGHLRRPGSTASTSPAADGGGRGVAARRPAGARHGLDDARPGEPDGRALDGDPQVGAGRPREIHTPPVVGASATDRCGRPASARSCSASRARGMPTSAAMPSCSRVPPRAHQRHQRHPLAAGEVRGGHQGGGVVLAEAAAVRREVPDRGHRARPASRQHAHRRARHVARARRPGRAAPRATSTGTAPASSGGLPVAVRGAGHGRVLSHRAPDAPRRRPP